MAERLFRARIATAVPVVTSSAGVNALVGRPMHEPAAEVLRELGGDPGGHNGRRLEMTQAAAADLVLTAEVGHRSVIVQAQPLAFRRTFTFREFGRLGGALDALRRPKSELELRNRVAEVAGQRGLVEPPEPGADDILDPFGAPLEVARLVGSQVSAAVDTIIAVLGLERDPAVL